MRTRSPAWEPAEPTAPDPNLAELIAHARELIAGRSIAVITGAGISTGSGIPDYRGPGSPQRTPMTVQQFLGSEDFRRHYWARNHLGWRFMDAAVPNAAHRNLAAIAGVRGIITQNVDLLHLKAGSPNVLDLHGNYARVRCLGCGAMQSRHALDGRLEPLNRDFVARVRGAGAIEVAPDADANIAETADFVMVGCERCGGILKPDIVYFGESVPKDTVAAAFAMVDDAETLLVLGSTLSVMSGLRFVRRAATDGKPIVIINRGHTRADGFAGVKIDAELAEALELWVYQQNAQGPERRIDRE